MKKRWIALDVENHVGVLAKIAGLFSGKAYNLDSLTVGTTEDETVSHITLGAICGDETFEQIKKQLNRMVDIIKVVDLTGKEIIRKELLFIKIDISDYSEKMIAGLKGDIEKFQGKLTAENEASAVIEALHTEEENQAMIQYFVDRYDASIVRGGSVAVEL